MAAATAIEYTNTDISLDELRRGSGGRYDPPMTQNDLPDSIAANIAEWSETNAQFTDAQAERAWAPQELSWGVFGVPEADIGSPLGDVAGLDVVELGCGTAYFAAQLAQRGARPVGVDPTPAQLATARRMMDATGIRFPLVEAPGERVPLPDASFDLAFSEYGASLWADPAKWVPEAARLLRRGGRLVFLTNSFIAYLCAVGEGGTSETLQRPQFGPPRMRWPGETGVEYHLPHVNGSTCCARTASRSSGSSSRRRRRRRSCTSTTRTCRPSGRGSGRRRRSGWRVCAVAAASSESSAGPSSRRARLSTDISLMLYP